MPPRARSGSSAPGLGVAPPPLPADDRIEAGEALLWERSSGRGPIRVEVVQPELQRRRHARKYSEGELGEDRSFYFRGPDGALSLRAQNLSLFLQIAAGVDDGTWLHHLRAGDYSAWIRDAIKDEDLAERGRRGRTRSRTRPERQPGAHQGGGRPPLHRPGLGATRLGVKPGRARCRPGTGLLVSCGGWSQPAMASRPAEAA